MYKKLLKIKNLDLKSFFSLLNPQSAHCEAGG